MWRRGRRRVSVCGEEERRGGGGRRRRRGRGGNEGLGFYGHERGGGRRWRGEMRRGRGRFPPWEGARRAPSVISWGGNFREGAFLKNAHTPLNSTIFVKGP